MIDGVVKEKRECERGVKVMELEVRDRTERGNGERSGESLCACVFVSVCANVFVPVFFFFFCVLMFVCLSVFFFLCACVKGI